MGVSYTTDESVFDLLQGLPDGIEWEIFREFTMNKLSLNSTSSTLVSSSTTSSSTSPSSPQSSFTFANASKLLLEKANTIVGHRKLAGLGLEYANVAVKPGKTNPLMGVRIHKNNPSGVHCTNPLCNGKPRAETHDKEHCYWPGGGMEAQAPAWARPRNPKTESAAIAKVEQTLPSPPETPQIIHRELSCTVITELDPYLELVALASPGPFATILDSSATLHLIKDRGYFVDFVMEDRPPVKTANQGTLQTSGRGSCVVELMLNADTYCIVLKDCLHTPRALLNLFSVGRMLQYGWGCEFKGCTLALSPSCVLSHQNEVLGCVPLLNNLCYLPVRFRHPNEIHSRSPMYKEICASATSEMVPEISTFAKLQLTWDTWHARMGHPGGDIVHHLPLVATGVNVDVDVPSTRCESCIMAKHPRQPHPPSSTPCVKHILDLVHSDVCGPFPVPTPHGKLYFIIFLDDHMHLINVQLPSSKDQALEAWNIVRAKWENVAERWIKVFRSDNGGEFLSFAFKKALQDAGIEHQLSSPYSHQQNGKAERALCTLQGHALAMLEAARLPPYLWGKAVLTAGYLWNHTESSTLPTGKTPFEMVNRRKPDLSHFHVFGSRCWAHIPSELQRKLGPQSHPALFMGYPDGVKGYRVHDRSSGAFFTACDVIFDEQNPTLADDSDDSEEEDSSPSHPTPPTIPPPTPSTTGPRCSGRECKLTEKGTAWTADLAATRV